jgi:bacterioferritin
MKAGEGIIDHLNSALTVELTAVNQYFVQAEMVRNWGFERLYQKLRESSMEEMQDAQSLIRHILFLEGIPNMQRMNRIQVGESVLEHLQLDLSLEADAVVGLTQAIAHCARIGDFATRGMLEEMITSEQAQIDWLETQLSLITTIGLGNYLAQQLT